ncbi:MAG: phage terminase large subunit [Brevundimonas sp.]
MTTLPLPPKDFVHTVARTNFEVFLGLTFHHLNPGKALSRGWYLEAMAQALADVAEGRSRRLQITVPPRHLKSVMTTVAFPAWLMGRRPETRIICTSYSQDLSSKLARDFRKVMQSNWYAAVFPETAASVVRDTENDLGTRQGGYRFSTALGGTVTGLGADLIIIDDLMKAQDARYPEARQRAQRFVDETLLSRLDDKDKGSVIAIQQRLHEDDICAHLMSKGRYVHLNLPAIATRDEIIRLTRGRTHARRIGDILNPERESQETLDLLRKEIGARAFSAQYQQDPTPSESDNFRWEKVQFYEQAPERHRIQKVVISWDTAASTDPKADYSVGTVWGHDGEFWCLLDVIREKLTYSDLLARARRERSRWQADRILIEGASVGLGLFEDLRRDMRGLGDQKHQAPSCTPILIRPEGSKEDRFLTSAVRLYDGFAKLPREAPWLEDLRHELLGFPDSRHDDQVDSISQFLKWAVGPVGRSTLLNREARRDGPRPA